MRRTSILGADRPLLRSLGRAAPATLLVAAAHGNTKSSAFVWWVVGTGDTAPWNLRGAVLIRRPAPFCATVRASSVGRAARPHNARGTALTNRVAVCGTSNGRTGPWVLGGAVS